MRIRSIKPEFWQSETMAKAPYFARLMAIAILNYADDEGFFWAVPQVIQGALFPFEEDSKNVLGSFQDLSRVGFLAFGTDEHGKRIGKVVNFCEHQRIDKPQPSKIADLVTVWGEFQEPSRSDPGALPPGREGNGREGNGMEKEGKRIGRRKGTRAEFIPPSIEEWQAHCATTWPDWHPDRSAEGHAYYTNAKWKVGKAKKQAEDWKACASTAHKNATEWGTLQPKMEPPTLAEWLEFSGSFAAQNAPFSTEPRFIWPEDLAKAAFSTHKAKSWNGITDWKSQAKADCRYWVGREISNQQRPTR